MIRITVELLPWGRVSEKEHLGTAYIVNTVEGTETRGTYTCYFSRKGSPTSIWKRGKIFGFPRKKRLAWDLLYLALKEVLKGRND